MLISRFLIVNYIVNGRLMKGNNNMKHFVTLFVCIFFLNIVFKWTNHYIRWIDKTYPKASQNRTKKLILRRTNS